MKKLIKRYAPEAVLGLLAKHQLERKGGGLKERQRLHESTQEKIESKRAEVDYAGSLAPNEFEYRLNSQNGEDGILDLIFSLIGFESRTFVEVGFSATEANCLNIGVLHALHGVFVDQNPLTCRTAKAMFAACGLDRFTVRESFVTRNNFNEILDLHRLPKEIDLLSIDIDGNDYWLWEGLHRVRPRVLVIEYNDRLGPDAAVTIPYDSQFRYAASPHNFYVGASLRALSHLGERRGYRLVAVDTAGVNAFFLATSVPCAELQSLDVEKSFRFHHRSIERPLSPLERQDIIRKLPFQYV